MDALSPWTYGRRSARKMLPVVIILSFVVMLVLVILSTLAGLKDSMLVYTREFDEWTIAFPKRDTRLPKDLLAAIAAQPGVERVIDSRNCFVRVKTLVGPVPFSLRAVKQEEMKPLMDRVGARLATGSLPRPGTNEVALHENLMRANGWPIGQEFGMEVNEDDWMPGRFKVVGLLEGPTPIGLASFEFLNNPLQYVFSAKLWERAVVLAKPGRVAEVNAFLRSQKDVKVYDKARAVDDISQGFDRIILIFQFISAVLIVVVALVTGLINNMFFAQRIDEFAILLAIGHTRRRLFRLVAGETLILMGVSWALGAVLGFAVFAGFREFVLLPRGIPIPFFHLGPLLVSAAMPLVAQVFANVTVAGRLRRIDPVSIIERRG